MKYRRLINGAVTAALSGGAMATAVLTLDPQHFDWERTAQIFAAGAAIGVLNWLRRAPRSRP